jgi:hypothetical protein
MIDNPEKTARLLAALKEAVPFKVELTERLIKHLRGQHIAAGERTEHTVSDLSYAGDEGGIVCHMVRSEEREALVVSLTQVWVPRSMPLSAAVDIPIGAQIAARITTNKAANGIFCGL